MKLTFFRLTVVAGLVSALLLQTGFAQSFSSDARRIALGGAGSSDNIASKLIEERQSYSAIPLPLGLIQLVKKREIFDPNDPNYDPVRAIEYAANPLHLTTNRDSSSAGNLLVKNLVNGNFTATRDLNTYRGFSPSQQIDAQGLISPNWGKTFNVVSDKSAGKSHGFYLGAGPYLSIGTVLGIDQKLIDLWASPTNVIRANDNFLIQDTTKGQAALAVTGGYRARLPVKGFATGGRDGVYVAANYSHLVGWNYESAALDLRFDTDSQGLVIVQPTTAPLVVNRTSSTNGTGLSIDTAVAIVKQRWEGSFGVDGIGNRINWKNLTGRRYALRSLVEIVNDPTQNEFVTTTVALPSTTERVTLPVRYTASLGYHTDRWSAATDMGRSLQGFRFNAGAEYFFGKLVFRGGTRYSRKLLHGSGGIGFNLTKGFGVDWAAFQTSSNIESERKMSFALSLRLNRSAE